jgi:hypothetical protein
MLPFDRRKRSEGSIFLFWLLTAAILLTALFAYWPGLNGPFLFDDFANLPALGKFGQVDDLESLKLFVLSGISGPTGRPVALASFLIDGNTWPTDPYPFKRTNLILHCITGLALFGLLRSILSATNSLPSREATLAALLTASIWLLHPFLVSTVLYVVQRMAILSALFVILGLWGYVHGRSMIGENNRRAYTWMTISLTGGTLFATLSKENGALLPILALVIEYSVLRKKEGVNPRASWVVLFLWLPLAGLAAYFLASLLNGSFAQGYSDRPFTLVERLLTESRILLDYLGWWIYPQVSSPGLLTQDTQLSRSLLDPPVTLAAVIATTALLVSAVTARQRYPLYSLAILFFFTGHILESSFIPLELYYEHRNYLPVAFLALPLCVLVIQHVSHVKILKLLIPVVVIVLAFLTYQRAATWGDTELLAYSLAERHPASQRAQRYAAIVAEQSGKPDLAVRLVENARAKIPDSLPLHLHSLLLKCRYSEVNQRDLNELNQLAVNKPYDFRTFSFLEKFVDSVIRDGCGGIAYKDVRLFLQSLLKNPTAQRYAGPKRQVYHLIGQLELHMGNGPLAADAFMMSQQVFPDPEAGLKQAALLAAGDFPEQALQVLDTAEKSIVKSRATKGKKFVRLDYEKEIQHLRQVIITDLEKKKEDSASSREH